MVTDDRLHQGERLERRPAPGPGVLEGQGGPQGRVSLELAVSGIFSGITDVSLELG
jgi:hypothetical protein